MPRYFILLAVFLALWLASPAARAGSAAEVMIGTSCSTGNNNIDWDTVGQCNGTVFAHGPLILGAMTDPPYSATTCSSSNAGMIQWTGSVMEYCDGTNWDTLAANGGGTCSAPSGLSFTNLTSQALNTVVTSNTATITFTGCTGTLVVSVTGAATAQISVNGGTWATSGAISSGQTLQVRMTTSGSVSTVLTATVTVGSSSTNWTTTTVAGAKEVFMTSSTYIGGSIGSLTAADALCQTAANTAGYSGTFKAIMSDASNSAASRLTFTYPIVNAYDSSTVASTNLFVGSLNGVIKTPTGGSGNNIVQTGTSGTGGIVASENCTSWSSTSGSSEDGIQADNTTAAWTAAGTNSCGNAYYLYCLQQ
jgi:hypothetical protein